MHPSFSRDWLFVNRTMPKLKNDFSPDSHYYTPEASVIQAIVTSVSDIESIDRDIKDDYFDSLEAKHFWKTINRARANKLDLDLVVFFKTAVEIFIEEYELEPPKEMARACSDLFDPDFCSSTQNVNYHVRKFLQQFFRREIRASMALKTSDAFDKGIKLQHDLDRLMTLDKRKTAELFSSSDITASLLDKMVDREEHPEKYVNVNWCYKIHNEKIPINRGHLIIIGGRSGSGKTTYAMNILRMKLLNGEKIAMFSLEMTKEEIATMLNSQVSQVPYEAYFKSSSELTQDQIDAISLASNQISRGNAVFVETANLSVEDIRRQAIQIKSKLKGLDAIFVDHIHIMGDDGKKFPSMRERIIHISSGLKNLAKEIDCPIFALAQMNRNSESRSDKTPITADLKESGSLEQDADAIVFTYRNTDPNKEHEPSFIICRKNRHGTTCDFKINMKVDSRYKLFKEY